MGWVFERERESEVCILIWFCHVCERERGVRSINVRLTEVSLQNWSCATHMTLGQVSLYFFFDIYTNMQQVLQPCTQQILALYLFIYFHRCLLVIIYLEKGQGFFSNSSYIFLLDINFENLIIRLHVFCILNMPVKFCLNRMLFTIWSINLFLIHNFRPWKLEI